MFKGFAGNITIIYMVRRNGYDRLHISSDWMDINSSNSCLSRRKAGHNKPTCYIIITLIRIKLWCTCCYTMKIVSMESPGNNTTYLRTSVPVVPCNKYIHATRNIPDHIISYIISYHIKRTLPFVSIIACYMLCSCCCVQLEHWSTEIKHDQFKVANTLFIRFQ